MGNQPNRTQYQKTIPNNAQEIPILPLEPIDLKQHSQHIWKCLVEESQTMTDEGQAIFFRKIEWEATPLNYLMLEYFLNCPLERLTERRLYSFIYR